MEPQLIQALTATYEGHAQQTENGVAYWLARDLQHLLGYGKWDNFQSVISKAKTACELSGHAIADHFADVGKMIELGKGGFLIIVRLQILLRPLFLRPKILRLR